MAPQYDLQGPLALVPQPAPQTFRGHWGPPTVVTETTEGPEFPSFTCQFLSAIQILGDLVWFGAFRKLKQSWRLDGFTREVTHPALLPPTGQLGLPSSGRHQQKHGGPFPAHI